MADADVQNPASSTDGRNGERLLGRENTTAQKTHRRRDGAPCWPVAFVCVTLTQEWPDSYEMYQRPERSWAQWHTLLFPAIGGGSCRASKAGDQPEPPT